MDSLDALLSIITSGISDIKAAYAAEGVSLPSLDEPYAPSSAELKSTPAVDLVVSAALQLVATIRPAPTTALSSALGMYETAALGTVVQHNIAEMLREAGSQGMHARDIGTKAGTSPEKIGRILRLLSSRHFFKEVSPDVFANNRLSSVLDTGKSAEENVAQPLKKYEKTQGVAAIVGHWADESIKSAAFFPEFFADQKLVNADESTTTPFNLAFRTPKVIWDFYAEPGNELRQVRFGAAMASIQNIFPPDLIIGAYPWKNLAPGSLVVDVGGGVGSVTLVLAKAFPELKFIVQDIPRTIEDGHAYWEREFPTAVSNGQVQLHAHDFFTPQPVKDASIFMLRAILHDWPTSYAKKILSQLRTAAQPSTKVLLVEQILINPTKTSGEIADDVKFKPPPPPPFPLIPGGGLGALIYPIDAQMMLVGGMERTISAWIEAVDGTGWRIDDIVPGVMSGIVLVPV